MRQQTAYDLNQPFQEKLYDYLHHRPCKCPRTDQKVTNLYWELAHGNPVCFLGSISVQTNSRYE